MTAPPAGAAKEAVEVAAGGGSADDARSRHLRKRSFSLAGHRTSVALEPAFWEALERIAAGRGVPLSRLVALTDAERADPAQPLASALRVMALRSAGA